MMEGLTNTRSAARLNRFKGIVYGPPNAGKTTLARTLQPLGKVLIVAAEPGLAALAGCDIDVWEVRSYDALQTFVAKLLAGEFDPWDVLYIDSLTEIGKLIEQANFGRFSTVDERGIVAVEKKNNFSYYGSVARDLEMFIRMVRDRRQHVIFSALPKSWKDDNSGDSGHRPLYGVGSFGEQLPGLFDFVFAYRRVADPESGELRRVLFTDLVDGWEARARQDVSTPVLPVMIPEPDLSRIIKAIIPPDK